MYYRQVHATVTLNTTLHEFESDSSGVRTAFVSGVAAAAGVAPEQVHVHYLVIRLSHRRRLLHGSRAKRETIQVSVVVSGTSSGSLEGLHRHLSRLSMGDSWEVRRRVLVLAIPASVAVAVEQNM